MRFVALILGLGAAISAFNGYTQYHSEQKNLQEMLAFCGTESYWKTDVQCIQAFLESTGDLKEDPTLYDVHCGGQSIGHYACF